MVELVLDSDIRDWVLIPLVVIMFVISVLRHHITIILTGVERKMVDLRNAKEA